MSVRVLAFASCLGLPALIAGCVAPASRAAEPQAEPVAETAPIVEPGASEEASGAEPSPAVEVAPEVPALATTPAPNHFDGRLEPLDEAALALIASGEEEPPAHFKVAYVVSNETRHDLMLPYLDGLGGAYVGVGAAQNYTLMAAARAELAFLVDLDQHVTDVHRSFAALIPLAETPEALRRMFLVEHADATAKLLEEAWAELDDAERRRRVKRWRATRQRLLVDMNRVARRKVEGRRSPTWMNDPALYEHVRTLFTQGRVRWLSGDLTGATTMQTIARITRELGVAVTVLYLSNAEEYFAYTPQFAANLRELPFVPESVVLRTLRMYGWVVVDDWHYQMQSLTDLRDRLADAGVTTRRKMLDQARRDGALLDELAARGTSVVGIAPR